MFTNIIDPENVIKGELPHGIIYGDGMHSKDLRGRLLLPEGTEEHPAHHVILPITVTERAVLELLENGISQEHIISYAGVMAKAPNGTPSVHALWGPAAMTKLKIAVAMETFGEKNILMRKLLETLTDKKITIIETHKTEHDSKMAVIQGLINLWLVMVGEVENEALKSQILQHWKTPIGTIVDMIHANPFAEILIKKFFESFAKHSHNVSKALEEAIDRNLTSGDAENFGTPNFERIRQFISQADGKIIMPQEPITQLQRELNSHGHTFLAGRIKKIQDKNKKLS